jgi:hypothetical protein
MSVTPTFEDVLDSAIQDALLNVNVCMPGVVESFDPKTDTIKVRPALKRKYAGDETATELPLLNRVPVVFPRGGNFTMKWNLKNGDPVTLVFSQRSLDVWKSSGGVVDPADPRRFHLSDAFAIPGGADTTKPIPDSVGDRTVLKSGSSKVSMLDNGKFRIEGAYEFLDLMSQTLGKLITLTDKLSTDTTNTGIGPQKLNAFSDYASLKSDLTTLKSNLDSIKG